MDDLFPWDSSKRPAMHWRTKLRDRSVAPSVFSVPSLFLMTFHISAISQLSVLSLAMSCGQKNTRNSKVLTIWWAKATL